MMSIWRKESIVGICNLTSRKIVRFPLNAFLCCAHNISWEHKNDSSAFFYKEKDHIISPLFCTPGKRTFSSKTLATLSRLNKRNGKSSWKYVANKNNSVIILKVLQKTETRIFLVCKWSQSYIWAEGSLSLANFFHIKKMPVPVPY